MSHDRRSRPVVLFSERSVPLFPEVSGRGRVVLGSNLGPARLLDPEAGEAALVWRVLSVAMLGLALFAAAYVLGTPRVGAPPHPALPDAGVPNPKD